MRKGGGREGGGKGEPEWKRGTGRERKRKRDREAVSARGTERGPGVKRVPLTS